MTQLQIESKRARDKRYRDTNRGRVRAAVMAWHDKRRIDKLSRVFITEILEEYCTPCIESKISIYDLIDKNKSIGGDDTFPRMATIMLTDAGFIIKRSCSGCRYVLGYRWKTPEELAELPATEPAKPKKSATKKQVEDLF